MKKYKFGVVCGRFQPLHTGHCAVIDKAMQECERVAVFVGSAQEYRTKRNPLSYKERFDAINCYCLGNVEIYPINDLTNGADVTGEWGRYFLNIVEGYAGARPDAIYTAQSQLEKNGSIQRMLRVSPKRSLIKVLSPSLQQKLEKNSSMTNTKTLKNMSLLC